MPKNEFCLDENSRRVDFKLKRFFPKIQNI